jgi:HD-GYP domain-containing protein (c-di-GMP phosphodiesterase class II)/putative methionine-R-sulfoxide reductase with GAF domain
VVEITMQLSLLNEAARAMTSLMEPDPLLDRILDLTAQVFGFHACAILLVEPQSGELRIRRARGYDPAVVATFRGKAGEGVTGRAFAERRTVLVSDVHQAAGYVSGVPGAVSEVAVPLALDATVIGVLDAESREPLHLSEAELSLLTAFASHAAVAVHNARLHDQVARHSAALERKLTLQQVVAMASEAMLSTFGLDEVLEEILALAQVALPFESCAVLLHTPGDPDLVVRAAHGYKQEVKGLRIPVERGITGEVLRTARPVLVADVQADPRYIEGVSGGRCEMAVPLAVRGQVIGVLDAEACQPGAFTPDDLEIFGIFAGHAAVAVRNAELHARLEAQKAALERRASALASLNQVGKQMARILDLDALLAEILRLGADVLPFDHCAVLLLEEDGKHLRVRAARGYSEEGVGLRIPVGRGVTGRAVEERRTIYVADVLKEPRYIQGVAGGRCELAAPLSGDGEVIGVLDAEAQAPDAFGEADRDLFETFTAWVGVAVHNARLYANLARANASLTDNVAEIERMNAELTAYSREISQTNQDLERRVRELVTLHAASQTITSSLDLSETLQTIVRMTQDIVSASSSAIRLLDEESQELRMKVSAGAELPATAPGAAPSPHLEAPLRIGDRTIGFFELGRATGEFTDEEKQMLSTLASQAAIAIENARLFERTQRTYYETIRSLAEALEARDAYTRGHSERVTKYSLAIAEALGLSDEELKVIGHAGLLHDIGKIGISDTILHKTTMLTAEDRKAIEHHPLFGDTILGPLKFLQMVQTVVKHHHERFDGSGYPDKLRGDDIPLAARIVAVADSFDAMTSDRPYRLALARATAVGELIKGRGILFDPRVVDTFLGLLDSRF